MKTKMKTPKKPTTKDSRISDVVLGSQIPAGI
jgi:hypothetical protein